MVKACEKATTANDIFFYNLKTLKAEIAIKIKC